MTGQLRLGVDLGGTKTEAIVLDEHGAERARLRTETPQGDYEGTVRNVATLVNAIAQQTGASDETPVGVGIPGTISPYRGLVKNANSTCLIGRPLDQDLEAALGRKVRLENDANCFTISEATDGAGRAASIVFGVILGTGVGGGIAYNKKSRLGLNALSGEWGHNPLPWPQMLDGGEDERPGPDCYCGKQGCIETFLSGPGMELDFKTNCGSDLSTYEIVAGAEQGNDACQKALARYEHRLARGLASVINILDPDVIVLGGGMSNLKSLYEKVPKIWADWVFSDRCETRLLKNIHGDSSGVRGAAWLWEPA